MQKLTVVGTFFLIIFSLTACNGSSDEEVLLLKADSQGSANIDISSPSSQLDTTPTGDLTSAEAESIIFMREEEKLARDVYTALYHIYGTNIFTNIAASEQTHTDAIRSLIDRYNLIDPMATDIPGVFNNSELQFIYDSLVGSGSISLLEAFYVGARIEELDIYDIERLKEIVFDNDDIILIYNNLLKGSRNHLRSFDKQIKANGAVYSPIYISQEQYDSIINTPIERK
jgi:hypothetical protein